MMCIPMISSTYRSASDMRKRSLSPGFVFLGLCIMAIGTIFCTGCAGNKSPSTSVSAGTRDPARAQQLTLQAADLLDSGPEKLARAESLLRDALAADLFHGPAHNNLGVVYLKQSKLYEAANEFEWARKLMPGHPDPRVNLGVTLERAGRMDDALQAYTSALEAYPDHLPATQALVRLQIRTGRTDTHTRPRLESIALRGDPTWQTWARLQHARMPE